MEQQQGRVCRTCLKKVNKREKMFSIYKISGLLMSYTSLNIIENDGLPPNICTNCYQQANDAHKFIMLCEESDKKLRTDLNSSIKTSAVNEDNDTDSIKLEIFDNDTCLSGNSPNALMENESDSIVKVLEKSHVKEESMNETVDDDHRIFLNIKSEINVDEKSATEGYLNHTTKRKRYHCRFCDMTFKQLTRLLRHEIKHENGIKCYICDKTYSTFKQLRSHINIHNRKGAHLCQTCGKQFTMPENLVRHQRIHTGIRPYKCKLCNKCFTQSNELKSHLITHSTEKTHLCNVCGNKYARQMSLQVHMRRLHSDASIRRPYPCEICGRTFKDKRDLSQHTSIHKGERKHVCKVCGKAFNRSSNLKVHERIHSGYRPFVCPICQRAFIQKHVLNTHLRTHPNTSV